MLSVSSKKLFLFSRFQVFVLPSSLLFPPVVIASEDDQR